MPEDGSAGTWNINEVTDWKMKPSFFIHYTVSFKEVDFHSGYIYILNKCFLFCVYVFEHLQTFFHKMKTVKECGERLQGE